MGATLGRPSDIEGFAALDIDLGDKQVRKAWHSIVSAGSNRQFSKLEFDRLVRHIQYARDETDTHMARHTSVCTVITCST